MIEDFFFQNASVGDAIERNTARQAKIPLAGYFASVSRQAQHDFFGDDLNGSCNVHVTALDRCFWPARRPAKQAVKILVEHGGAAQEIEIIEVQPEGTVRFQIEQVLVNGVDEFRLPIGSKAHELVLAGINAKTAIGGEGRVQQT